MSKVPVQSRVVARQEFELVAGAAANQDCNPVVYIFSIGDLSLVEFRGNN